MGKSHAIWITTLAGSRPMRLETESSDQHGASWSPDGNWISYWRHHNGKWSVLKAAVGGGNIVALVTGLFWGPVAMIPETAWAPSGEWICYNGPEGLYLVSPDGERRKAVAKTVSDNIAFSTDSATIYALRRAVNGKWQLVYVDIRSGQESRVVPVEVADGATLSGLTIHPDGKRFATSVGWSRHDIWLMDGFRPR
jgi:Tol biopolymer transport system component